MNFAMIQSALRVARNETGQRDAWAETRDADSGSIHCRKGDPAIKIPHSRCRIGGSTGLQRPKHQSKANDFSRGV
jgi:hypothetical protein